MCVHGLNVGVIARGTAGGKEPEGLFFAIDLVVHLLLNGTSLVTRDGAEDAHVRVPLSLIHISEPTRLGMISYAVFCLKKKNASHEP